MYSQSTHAHGPVAVEASEARETGRRRCLLAGSGSGSRFHLCRMASIGGVMQVRALRTLGSIVASGVPVLGRRRPHVAVEGRESVMV